MSYKSVCVRALESERAKESVSVCVSMCACVCVFHVLTRYFSRGSVSNASPNIDRQYSAILACCFGLGVVAHTKKTNTDTHIVNVSSVIDQTLNMYVLFPRNAPSEPLKDTTTNGSFQHD